MLEELIVTRVLSTSSPHVVDQAAPVASERGRWPTWIRLAFLTGSVVALCAAAVARVGRFGFNPTDQGFILAQSWRILHGEVPHADVISPRPLGSAYLHLVDFLLPAPLLVASSFVTMVELALATIALAALLTGTSPLAWSWRRSGLVAAAILINLNTFPLMAWHTIDGLFLIAVGWWALDSGLRAESTWRRRLGLVCLGFAAIVKQSFVAAVPIAFLVLLVHPAVLAQRRRSWPRTAVDVLYLGLVPLLYAAAVAAAGELDSAVRQLTAGMRTWGEGLFQFWSTDIAIAPPDLRAQVLAAAAAALLIVVCALSKRTLGSLAQPMWVLAAVSIAVITVSVLIQGKFEYAGHWSIALWWIFLAVTAMEAAIHRRLPWQHLLVAALAWMCILSWGYPYPSLLAGTMALGAVDWVARSLSDLPRPGIVRWRRWSGTLGAVAATVAVVLAGFQVAAAHDRAPYADRPQGELTADLGDAAPSMRWIRSSTSTHAYVTQIRDCIAHYPASRVAVLPDNPFVYPVFELRNPFPMDWPLPLEMADDAKLRMLEAARALDRDGDYLVLFQTVTAAGLAAGQPVPVSVSPQASITGYSDIEARIRDTLTGQKISCGAFLGVWAQR